MNKVTDNNEIPLWLDHLSDSIHKELPEEHRDWWRTELAKSVSTKTDFQSALHAIQIAILEMALENKDQWHPSYGAQCVKAIENIIDCHRNPEKADWIAAARAATSAAGAAWSTDSAAMKAMLSAVWGADSAVLRVAWSAADAADSAARAATSAAGAAWSTDSAAWNAAASTDSATWKAAKSAAFHRIAKATIEILAAN